MWKRKKDREKRTRFKLNGKFQNWEQISEALQRVQGYLFIYYLLFIIIYLILTLVIYKWNINNLENTMIVKITTIFSIANLSQPDTLI